MGYERPMSCKIGWSNLVTNMIWSTWIRRCPVGTVNWAKLTQAVVQRPVLGYRLEPGASQSKGSDLSEDPYTQASLPGGPLEDSRATEFGAHCPILELIRDLEFHLAIIIPPHCCPWKGTESLLLHYVPDCQVPPILSWSGVAEKLESSSIYSGDSSAPHPALCYWLELFGNWAERNLWEAN